MTMTTTTNIFTAIVWSQKQ